MGTATLLDLAIVLGLFSRLSTILINLKVITIMSKVFASQGDMSEKKISFTEVGDGLFAFTAEGDPNSGVIIGDDSVMIIEAQATPRLAKKDRKGSRGDG